jgi:hypothetical protein
MCARSGVRLIVGSIMRDSDRRFDQIGEALQGSVWVKTGVVARAIDADGSLGHRCEMQFLVVLSNLSELCHRIRKLSMVRRAGFRM